MKYGYVIYTTAKVNIRGEAIEKDMNYLDSGETKYDALEEAKIFKSKDEAMDSLAMTSEKVKRVKITISL